MSPTRSKLEAYRSIILKEWIEGTSVLEIVGVQQAAGSTIKRTRVSNWIADEVKAGRFPSRKEPCVGRPKKSRPPFAPAPSEPAAAPAFKAEEFREMEGFLKAVIQQLRPTELAAQLAIPFTEFGDPDFRAFAKGLGREGVARLGRMDCILLGMYSLLLARSNPQDDPKCLDLICMAAETIRRQMQDDIL